jgi:hypothetical protein
MFTPLQMKSKISVNEFESTNTGNVANETYDITAAKVVIWQKSVNVPWLMAT